MKTYLFPEKNTWNALTTRPALKTNELEATVNNIFEEIRKNGDKALLSFTEKFDKVQLTSVGLSSAEWNKASKNISSELKNAIKQAARNIRTFHTSQKEKPRKIVTSPGVTCWRESRPIQRVGIYIPGGTAPLFSTVLMLAIPAKIAGCPEIVLCTPPDANGNIHPAILYAAKLSGVSSIFRIGGIQAIGALTFGTESIPKVDKIFGPGNQYVTAAKQMAQKYGMAIDMPAGPSEVLVIADETSVPEFVAADLLSQAEHGADSQVMLLTTRENIVNEVMQEIEKQLKLLPREQLATAALQNSKAIVLSNLTDCIAFSNLYAPEHLILATRQAQNLVPEIINAGSVFLGNFSCESAGDYASGTNHTLPTNGFARNYSGVSLDSFIRKITFQEITEQGILNLGKTIEIMAEAELLLAHKNAVTVRLQAISKTS